jgi:hypothetical protein
VSTHHLLNTQSGSLEPIQVLPSTPPSYTAENTGAGPLTPVGWAPTNAKCPVSLASTPAGKILYAANADAGVNAQQNTDTIVAYGINQVNGMLAPTGRVMKTNSPCTIVFAGAQWASRRQQDYTAVPVTRERVCGHLSRSLLYPSRRLVPLRQQPPPTRCISNADGCGKL